MPEDADTIINQNITQNVTIKIEPLTGSEDYRTWKVRMMDALFDQDLMEYPSGDTKKPEPTELWLARPLSTVRICTSCERACS